MESIGERLRLARERGNYTLEQVSRDTHVAKRFLKALEDEDFSVFPGETYAMGFLRTYAEYLGLDSDELVAAYRNIKIQEQPLPMTELLDTRPRIRPRVVIIAAAAAVIVLGLGALVLVRVLGSRGTGTPRLGVRSASEEFTFEQDVGTRWFMKGDTILVPLASARYRVEVSQVGDALTLKVPGGTVELALGRERLIDLDGDSQPDLKIVWNDVDRTSTEPRAHLALFRVATSVAAAPAAASTAGQAATTGAASGQAPAAQTAAGAGSSSRGGAGAAATQPAAPAAAAQPARTSTTAPATATTTAAGSSASTAGVATATPAAGASAPGGAAAAVAAFKAVTVETAAATAPFTVDFLFRGDCLFRYMLDGGDIQERFFQRDEQFSLEAKARMTLWLSNAGAVRATVAGKQTELGRPGEVGVRSISWRGDETSGGYVLLIEPVF